MQNINDIKKSQLEYYLIKKKRAVDLMDNWLINKKKKSSRSNGQLVNSFSTTAEKRKYMVDFDKNIK